MRSKIIPVLLVVFVLLSATDVNATGYRLYEIGAKAAMLAGAFTGSADNTSAMPGYEYTYDSAFWVVGCGVGMKI